MASYRTVQGDTWDIISKKQYGSEKYVDVLIESNWQEHSRFIFPAGIVLSIPDLPQSAASAANLPPWRRKA